MRWLLFFTVLLLGGCSEQRPVEVIAAKPSIRLNGTSRNAAVERDSLHFTKKSDKAISIVKRDSVIKWAWPARGKVISKFSSQALALKGIDIADQEGTPVYAAGSGEVVYSGCALRGYGNLLIIKHDENYLTAYAHNRVNLVKEGDRVTIGQKIAEMGRTGTDRVKLHFEVRYKGKPIDPQTVLPSKG